MPSRRRRGGQAFGNVMAIQSLAAPTSASGAKSQIRHDVNPLVVEASAVAWKCTWAIRGGFVQRGRFADHPGKRGSRIPLCHLDLLYGVHVRCSAKHESRRIRQRSNFWGGDKDIAPLPPGHRPGHGLPLCHLFGAMPGQGLASSI
jgi:hypothetical protein